MLYRANDLVMCISNLSCFSIKLTPMFVLSRLSSTIEPYHCLRIIESVEWNLLISLCYMLRKVSYIYVRYHFSPRLIFHSMRATFTLFSRCIHVLYCRQQIMYTLWHYSLRYFSLFLNFFKNSVDILYWQSDTRKLN